MDAVKFVKEYLRMCSQPWDCEDCPLNKTDFCSAPAKKRSQGEAEEVVRLVEKWSAAHPRRTRQDLFLEHWPNAEIDCQGVIAIDPCDIDKTMHGKDGDCYNGNCDECRLDFWTKEME